MILIAAMPYIVTEELPAYVGQGTTVFPKPFGLRTLLALVYPCVGGSNRAMTEQAGA
jgi:hypothetical protein